MGSVQPPNIATSRPGVLTKTIVRTPVVKFILHARIRHWRLNDVVFVGEDFIQIKQVRDKGHLEHIATKDDFDAHITAAKTFSLDHDPPDSEDDFIKTEQSSGRSGISKSELPPQFVVLTLDSDELVFLYLRDEGDGVMKFVHQTCPMPSFQHTIHQTGFHLAVDPASRALAVAGSEKEIAIYSAKPTDLIRQKLESNDLDWLPVAPQRALSVSGVIQHLEFLHPPDNDPDHIILLLVLVDQRRTKAQWFDWYGASGMRSAQLHPAQPMDAAKAPTNLLVPLRDAAFLMITGSEIKLHKNILSGSMRSLLLDPDIVETNSPGSSSRRPIWTNWCRPLRNKSVKHGQDIAYLVREDGVVILVEVTSIDTIHASHAGDLECHVGSAFASLGDPSDPDILAVVGDMSAGRVVHMGNWPSQGRIAEMSRADAMVMRASETLPNWASSFDMVVSRLPQSHSRSPRTRDGIIVTSGREPYGTVTELRKGLEARMATYFPLEALRAMTGAWVLPNVSTNSILMLFSTPSSSHLIDFSPDFDDPDSGEIIGLDENDTTALALDQRTLTAGVLDNRHLIQIGERSIYTCANLSANFEDRSRWDVGEGRCIIAAAIVPSLNQALVVTRGEGRCELLVFRHHVHFADQDSDAMVEGLSQHPESTILEEEPLCLATSMFRDRVVGLLATATGRLQLFALDTTELPQVTFLDSMQIVEDQQSLCDHIVLLQSKKIGTNATSDILAVCGLRDGRVMSTAIKIANGTLKFGESHSSRFGHETVRLTQTPNEAEKAYAFSGLDTCVLTWDGVSPQSLKVQNLWVADKARPELSQGAITTVCTMPPIDYLSQNDMVGSLADRLVVVSSKEVFFIANVDDDPTVVPRQIQVTGTPSHVIYAEQQRSLVCASTCTGVRSFPSDKRNAQPEERRQVWPAIDFIPANGDGVSFTFDLQPGERVNALLEWSFQSKGKPYSFILVGGSYSRQGSTEKKGRIAFLQPTIRNWEVEGVKETSSTKFTDPVYALALYDEMTYVACTGCFVVLSRFDDGRWRNICAPLKLANNGVSISVTGTLIYVSTSDHGLITLRLDRLPSRDGDGEYPYRLTLIAQPPRADDPLSHTILALNSDSNLALLSTKDKMLLGLTSPSADVTERHRTRLLFEANLPRSIARITQGSTNPLWNSDPHPGVLSSNLVGLSTDGSMTGIAILDEALWRRLFWLQRVLEWDKHLSPHAPEIPNYGTDAEDYEGRERGLPIGLASGSRDEIALFSADDIGLAGDRHINGDVLARVLQLGGKEKLVHALRNLAQRSDWVGEWVERHLDREIEEVEDVVEHVRALVGMWM